MKDQWNISVIRRLFLSTAMQQLSESDEGDWQKRISIQFIGEEGVDAGGLTREFFSLFFKQTSLFEDGSFSFNSEYIESMLYLLLGKVVARAILSGHSGPCCLQSHIVKFILTQEQPDSRSLTLEQLHRKDIVAVINEVCVQSQLRIIPQY